MYNGSSRTSCGSPSRSSCISEPYVDLDGSHLLCRVCHNIEPDRRGDAALSVLDILPPRATSMADNKCNSIDKSPQKESLLVKNTGTEAGIIEFISPEGERFVCRADIESGSYHQRDMLINLGCSCKNELSLAHYSCALKWFINHGSTVCEICGSIAINVRPADFNKVAASLKDYESLRQRTVTGEVTHVLMDSHLSVDPDALAAVRRQRLSEVSFWFNPHNTYTSASQGIEEPSFNIPTYENSDAVVENSPSKCSTGSTSLLIAIGSISLAIAWLISPHVGKRAGTAILYVILGVLCALTVIISLRFIFRFKYGAARDWVILFLAVFLVFGVWAQRTHAARSS